MTTAFTVSTCRRIKRTRHAVIPQHGTSGGGGGGRGGGGGGVGDGVDGTPL